MLHSVFDPTIASYCRKLMKSVAIFLHHVMNQLRHYRSSPLLLIFYFDSVVGMGLIAIAWLVVAEPPKDVCIHFVAFVYFQIVYISSHRSEIDRPKLSVLMVQLAFAFN